jgi:hypothetical protein
MPFFVIEQPRNPRVPVAGGVEVVLVVVVEATVVVVVAVVVVCGASVVVVVGAGTASTVYGNRNTPLAPSTSVMRTN